MSLLYLEGLETNKWLQSFCRMHCFSFDSTSMAQDFVDRPMRWSIWLCEGSGLVTLEDVEKGRQRLSQKALSLTEPQWSRGRSPTEASSLRGFRPKSIHGERPLQHNMLNHPFSCPLGHVVSLQRWIVVKECLTMYWHVTDACFYELIIDSALPH